MENLFYLCGGALAVVALGLLVVGIAVEERERRRLIERARERGRWPRPPLQLVEDRPALQTPKVIGRIGPR